MNSSNSQEPMDSMADVLGYVRKKGVRLWAENGQLHYKAPKGVLTQEEIERLRVYRGQIVALLEKATGTQTVEPRLEPRGRTDRVPLTFSQLSHWHWYQLGERRHLRQIASATRLRGRLNLDALRRSLAEVVRRHEALRTRIVLRDGIPTQEISELGTRELEIDDLTEFSERLREGEVKRRIEKHILESIDVTVDPLFGVRLLRLGDNEHVLIVAMEHMISDGFSGNILLRDLFTAYMQALKGRAFSLPAVPVQFADYAVWQSNAQKSWIEKHGAYWNERLRGCQRVRFPADKSLATASRLGWGTVSIQIGRDLKAELCEWCRRRRTTLAMSVFTAYVGLVLRWCNVSEAVIQYQTDGRVNPKVENTIGYFSFPLSLRTKLLDDDSFVDLMNRVTDEYCNAYEHADLGYIEAQVPRREFVRNSAFNWLPQASSSWMPQGSEIEPSDLDGSGDAITSSQIRFEHPLLKILQWDREPFIRLIDTDDEVVGGVHFPLNRHSIDTMERFGRNFLVFIRALLRRPAERVKDIVLL